MYTHALLLSLAAAAAAESVTITKDSFNLTTPGSDVVCGQYESSSFNGYKISTNGWGWSNGKGTQCSGFAGAQSILNARWYSQFNWENGAGSVKSYPSIEPNNYTNAYLSSYDSLKTSWDWSYTGDDLAANVCYHITFGNNPNLTDRDTFQVQVWLAGYGDISPLSSNGYPYTPIATPTIAGHQFDLAYGFNGRTKVYTFLPPGLAAPESKPPTEIINSFQGDLLDFTAYLEQNYASNGFNYEELYLKKIQAGSEVFLGTNALFSVNAYSIAVKNS